MMDQQQQPPPSHAIYYDSPTSGYQPPAVLPGYFPLNCYTTLLPVPSPAHISKDQQQQHHQQQHHLQHTIHQQQQHAHQQQQHQHHQQQQTPAQTQHDFEPRNFVEAIMGQKSAAVNLATDKLYQSKLLMQHQHQQEQQREQHQREQQQQQQQQQQSHTTDPQQQQPMFDPNSIRPFYGVANFSNNDQWPSGQPPAAGPYPPVSEGSCTPRPSNTSHPEDKAKKKLTCDQCDFSTFNKKTLTNHIARHTGQGLHACPHCPFNSAYLGTFKRHMIRKHNTKDLEAEQTTVEKKDRLQCPHCPFVTVYKKNMKKHIAKHTGEGVHKCQHCNYVTAYIAGFRKHMQKHAREEAYACPHCPYTSSWKGFFERHLASKHAEKKNLLMPALQLHDAQQAVLENHLPRHSQGDAKYQCSESGCSFGTEDLRVFKLHMGKHNKQDSYYCMHCSYTTPLKGLYKFHLTTHPEHESYTSPASVTPPVATNNNNNNSKGSSCVSTTTCIEAAATTVVNSGSAGASANQVASFNLNQNNTLQHQHQHLQQSSQPAQHQSPIEQQQQQHHLQQQQQHHIHQPALQQQHQQLLISVQQGSHPQALLVHHHQQPQQQHHHQQQQIQPQPVLQQLQPLQNHSQSLIPHSLHNQVDMSGYVALLHPPLTQQQQHHQSQQQQQHHHHMAASKQTQLQALMSSAAQPTMANGVQAVMPMHASPNAMMSPPPPAPAVHQAAHHSTFPKCEDGAATVITGGDGGSCDTSTASTTPNEKKKSKPKRDPSVSLDAAASKIFTCKQCPYSTLVKNDLRVHAATHSGKGLHSCPNCPFTTALRGTIKRHMSKHSRETTYECPYCPYKSSQKGFFDRHVVSKHTDIALHQCPHCSYSTPRKGTYRRHLETHLKDKQVRNKRSFRYRMLQDKPETGRFLCDHCDYSSDLLATLKRHMVKHTKDDAFCCLQCSYTSECEPTFLKHLQKHDQGYTDPKLGFSCPHCEYKTSTKKRYDAHIVSKHDKGSAASPSKGGTVKKKRKSKKRKVDDGSDYDNEEERGGTVEKAVPEEEQVTYSFNDLAFCGSNSPDKDFREDGEEGSKVRKEDVALLSPVKGALLLPLTPNVDDPTQLPLTSSHHHEEQQQQQHLGQQPTHERLMQQHVPETTTKTPPKKNTKKTTTPRVKSTTKKTTPTKTKKSTSSKKNNNNAMGPVSQLSIVSTPNNIISNIDSHSINSSCNSNNNYTISYLNHMNGVGPNPGNQLTSLNMVSHNQPTNLSMHNNPCLNDSNSLNNMSHGAMLRSPVAHHNQQHSNQQPLNMNINHVPHASSQGADMNGVVVVPSSSSHLSNNLSIVAASNINANLINTAQPHPVAATTLLQNNFSPSHALSVSHSLLATSLQSHAPIPSSIQNTNINVVASHSTSASLLSSAHNGNVGGTLAATTLLSSVSSPAHNQIMGGAIAANGGVPINPGVHGLHLQGGNMSHAMNPNSVNMPHGQHNTIFRHGLFF